MKNALTIDVEDWYQTHDFNITANKWSSYEDRIDYSTKTILELLSKHNIRATFFVLGCIAQKHPDLIKQISNSGHEIGSHGGWHRMVNTFTKEDFKKDLLFSKNILQDITGVDVCLYRSPSWSISSDTLWALNILEEEGFICDSSIQPFKTPLSGFNGAPAFPFHPVIDGRKLKLLEFPPTVLKLGRLCVPFSGGFYLRVLPFPVISLLLRTINRERPGMVYIHPWETDNGQPRLKVPIHIRFEHYLNLDATTDKMNKLLHSFNFAPLGEIIKGENQASFCLSN